MSHDTIFGILVYLVVISIVAVIVGKRMKAHRKSLPLPLDACPHARDHAYGPHTWTQDGWVRVCKFCGQWDYSGGDDYDGGPK